MHTPAMYHYCNTPASLRGLFEELYDVSLIEDRVKALSEVEREVRECRKCRLWATRTKPVPGHGNPNAEVMLIGEAPGYNEDLEGKPFVGAAGRFLDQLLALAELKRSDVFITNVLKCRPPNNRDPLPDEVEACTPYLDRQVAIIKPKVIICLGRHSASYVLSKAGVKGHMRHGYVSISAVRGQVFNVSYEGLKVMVIPTYHPAAGLYNPKLKKVIMEDFVMIGRTLKGARTTP